VELHTGRPGRSRFDRGRVRPLRTLLTTTAAVVGGMVIALSLTTHADADPSPGQLETEIDQKWNELEPVIEQHNQVRGELAANRTKVAQLIEQIRPLQLQVDQARARVAQMSARYYKSGPASTFNALLQSGSPTTFADQLSMLESIARKHEAKIHDVVTLRDKYDAQKKPLDELVAKLAVQEAELAAKAKQINDDIKKLNDMRLKAYGSTGGNGSLRPVPCPSVYPGGKAGIAVKVACEQVGKPYVWGADGPGSFDCSGLTMYAWAAAGVRLRHYTLWQWTDTRSVSRSSLIAGDLVFYYSDLHHVAMYIGNGYVVHAPHAGDVVRVKPIDNGPVAGYRRPG
jgi:peptidoglycan DL-endopeptidase CwlO